MTFRRNSATVLLDQIRQPMVVSLCEEIVKKLIALFFILFALLPASVFAQGITQQKLRFAPGKTQTTISGEIAGRQTIDYVVGAKRGQTMSIKFSPSNRFAFFNLLAPGTGEALFVGQDQGNPGRFTARLGTTGNYIIRVYLVRAAARRGETSDYNLTVAINSVAPPPPAGDFADGDAGGPDFWVVYGLTAGDRLNMRDRAVGDVDLDPVALLDQADRAAFGRFRRDMADREARGAAREAAVGDQRAGLAEALRLQIAGRIEHFLHARGRRAGLRSG
jgi:hypothetical protein